MRRTQAVAIILTIALVAFSIRPKPALALASASTTVAGAGAVVAVVGAVMMGKEESAQTGRTMLIAGLCVSAVSSTSAVLLDLLSYAAIYDRVLQLEQEARAGGGPLVDAFASAFGLSPSEVLQSVERVRSDHPVITDSEAARQFSETLIADLSARARISDTTATLILHDLQLERARIGQGNTPRHELLAQIVGVPVETLAPVVAAHLDEALEKGARPGEIVSARTVFAAHPQEILNGLIDDIVARHEMDLKAQAQTARARLAQLRSEFSAAH